MSERDSTSREFLRRFLIDLVDAEKRFGPPDRITVSSV